jgi:hypothetical protein
MKINWETGTDMTRYACGTTLALLLISLAVPVLGQDYFLYTPKPATAEGKPKTGEGILVRELTIQKGDTLSALSRRFSGRSSYFPQILLFNEIRNPNLIYTGDSIKVPVTRSESAEKKTTKASAPSKVSAAHKKSASKKPAAKPADLPVSELSLSDLKKTDVPRGKKRARHEQKKAPQPETKKPLTSHAAKPAGSHSPAAGKEALSGQKLFDRAYAAYRQGDCKSALELFDRYLADNASASQAADASLYKADCYLKLSGQ